MKQEAGSSGKVLLINPTITSARSARFPLAVMTLASVLEEQHYETRIIDGNVDRGFVRTAAEAVTRGRHAAVCITVMGGPQLVSAIAVSKALRAASPGTPIVWGGYFPTICPDAALASSDVDFVIRGQGEAGLLELLAALGTGRQFKDIEGLSWKDDDGRTIHNRDRSFAAVSLQQPLRYDTVENPRQYLKKSYLGQRTAGYQAALGCRYRCSFCGVNAMFQGKTALPAAERLERDLRFLKTQLGADSILFYDHNFFDREADMLPLLEVMARFQLPWWCFARSDALLNLSDNAWTLVRKSRLRMAYIGAESPSSEVLRDMRKGTSPDQTLAVVDKCRSMGVTPELSFMLAPPHDPEGETERSFEFIRRIKRLHPGCEIMLYINTPLPPRLHGGSTSKQRPVLPLRDCAGQRMVYPDSAEGWAQPQWVDYWCHQDAPWLSPRLRQRIADFTTVLGCRFPTITDVRAPAWQKAALRASAAWRYRLQRYDRPWELDALKRVVKLWDPRLSSL